MKVHHINKMDDNSYEVVYDTGFPFYKIAKRYAIPDGEPERYSKLYHWRDTGKLVLECENQLRWMESNGVKSFSN